LLSADGFMDLLTGKMLGWCLGAGDFRGSMISRAALYFSLAVLKRFFCLPPNHNQLMSGEFVQASAATLPAELSIG